VLDAAHLAPHRPVDLAATDVDYVELSGHKLYAPYGAGALVGRRDWLDTGAPHIPGGGDAVREVGVYTTTHWALAPQRHEGGTSNWAQRRWRRPAGHSHRYWTAPDPPTRRHCRSGSRPGSISPVRHRPHIGVLAARES
jgi:hypothetical protein